MPIPKAGTTFVEVSLIDMGERKREDLGDIAAFAQSIKANGLINPIVIDANYNLIAGFRRLLAIKELGLSKIETRFYEALSAYERRKLALEEELLQRKILSWQEEIKLKSELHELYLEEHKNEVRKGNAEPPWSQKKTADILNVNYRTLSEEIRLAQAIKEFPELLKAGTKTDAIRKMYRLREFAILQEIARRGGLASLTEDIEFLNADCLEVLPTIASGSIDLIVTDPPWGIDLTDIAGARAIDHKMFDDFQKNALLLYEKSIPEMYRVLKPGSHLYLFFGIEFYHQIYEWLVAAGFDVRRVPIIWKKDRPTYTDWEFKPMPVYELIFFAAKTTSEGMARRLKEATSDVLEYASCRQKIHPTEKPLELLKRIITLSSTEGEKVLDPFAGSAITLVAALTTRRKALGIEKDEEYWKLAMGRLKTYVVEEVVKEVEVEENVDNSSAKM